MWWFELIAISNFKQYSCDFHAISFHSYFAQNIWNRRKQKGPMALIKMSQTANVLYFKWVVSKQNENYTSVTQNHENQLTGKIILKCTRRKIYKLALLRSNWEAMHRWLAHPMLIVYCNSKRLKLRTRHNQRFDKVIYIPLSLSRIVLYICIKQHRDYNGK